MEMKGTYRSVGKTHQLHTNFNDWSDPTLGRITHKTKTENGLTEQEKKVRLDKFKVKSAYCQTDSEADNVRLMVKIGEPLIDHKEIRLLRLPQYNGLVLNLADDGYPGTSEYIKDLIVLDDMYCKHDENRTLIRKNSRVLMKLAEGLKKAERARNMGNRSGEVKAFMDLAIDFMNSSESSFYWLVEELIEQSNSLLHDPQCHIDPQVEATLRYHYSSYLFDNTHDLINAKIQLEMSMRLSAGTHWLVNADNKEDDILYVKSCILLSKISLEEAYELESNDVEKAIHCCRNSLYWAKQANEKSTIANVLFTLAQFYLDAKILSPVLDILHQHTILCKSNMFHRELCEGYILLSTYHEMLGNLSGVVEVLGELITFALDHGILDIVMKGHLKLAEIYGKCRIDKIKHHASSAFNLSIQLGKYEENELASCFLGISQGDQIFDDYMSLVIHAETLDCDALKRLVDWKMLRTPFFSDDKTILYQPETDENHGIKHICDRVKSEEMNYQREERARSLSRNITMSKRSRPSSASQRTETLRWQSSNYNFTDSSSKQDLPSIEKHGLTKSVSFRNILTF